MVQLIQLTTAELRQIISEEVQSVIKSELSELKPKQEPEDRWLSTIEVQKEFKISSVSLWKYRTNGRIRKFRKLGKSILYSENELRALSE